jgi:N-acylglucosamine-6-phosphate 2-epimerase
VTSYHPLLDSLLHGLVVSCQAEAQEPLHGSHIMAAMARAAAEGGAVGIRANGAEDIQAIRQAVTLPVIGIRKVDLPGYAVRITPRLEDAKAVAEAGAAIIAVDATFRPRPGFDNPGAFIQAVRQATGCLVMADVATFAEGAAAAQAGADLVGTTLSGYTSDSPQQPGPDYELIQQLASAVSIPVIAEGRIASPEECAQALRLGAFAVVVGAAITRPQVITRRFVDAIRAEQGLPKP